MLHEIIKARACSLRSHLIPLAIAPVSGDADRLQQVVWHVVANAIKFTPEGGRDRRRFHGITFALCAWPDVKCIVLFGTPFLDVSVR
jgi:signal transduction histidine kinase